MEGSINLKSCGELSAGLKDSLNRVMDARRIEGPKRESIGQVARFIQHVWREETKAIVDVPCGGGKSLWSLALIGEHVERSHRDPDGVRPLYLVVDTLKTGQERLDALLSLGVGRNYLGFYHSFWEDECTSLRREWGEEKGYRYDQVVKDRTLCMDCPVNHSCGFNNRYAERNQSVVIMTHEGFIRLLEAGRIPLDREIIIDEEPNPYFMSTFQRREIERLLTRLEDAASTMAEHSRQLEAVIETIRALHTFASEPRNHGCTREWTHHIGNEDKLAAYRHLRNAYSEIRPQWNSLEDETPWEEDFLREHHLTLMADLGYALREGSDAYVYADDSKVTIARRRMDLGISNKVLLLNGSASLGRYDLGEEMRVHSCPDLKPTYPNVVLHCLEGLPSKRRLKNTIKMTEYASFARVALAGRAIDFLALNKAPPGGEDSLIGGGADPFGAVPREHFREVNDCGVGRRGTIIGSNRWVEYFCGVIAMSLFTDVAHYALHASLRHGREITMEEMFQIRNGRRMIKVKSNGHLSPEVVDDEFRREAAHELYQTIMRLRCRYDSAATVEVVVMLPYVEILADLERLMPGIQVRGGDGDRLTRLWDLLRSEEPVGNAEWFDALDLDLSSSRNIQRGRELGEHFGRRPVKRGGNRTFWEVYPE